MMLTTVALLVSLQTPVPVPPKASIRGPLTMSILASTADWVSTHDFLSEQRGVELNPLLRWADNKPNTTVIAGIAGDILQHYVVVRYIAPKRPKLARTLLYLNTVYRVILTINNMRLK